MYNRYIRNDQGVYTRVPETDDPIQQHAPRQNSQQGQQEQHRQESRQPPHQEPTPPPIQERQPDSQAHRQGTPQPQQDGIGDSLSRALRGLLNRFHLENVDTGDLLLLLLLFLLFKEDADEELLFALGLLLIL